MRWKVNLRWGKVHCAYNQMIFTSEAAACTGGAQEEHVANNEKKKLKKILNLYVGCLITFLMWKKKKKWWKMVRTYCIKKTCKSGSLRRLLHDFQNIHEAVSFWAYISQVNGWIWNIKYVALNILSQFFYTILFYTIKRGRMWVKVWGSLGCARGETCIYCFNSSPLNFISHCTTTLCDTDYEEGKMRWRKLYNSLQSRFLLLFSNK